jgi:hypothetical protein
MNDIMSAIFILLAKMVQDSYFNKCLMMKSLFVPVKEFNFLMSAQDYNHFLPSLIHNVTFIMDFSVYILHDVPIKRIYLEKSGGAVLPCFYPQTGYNMSIARKWSQVNFLIQSKTKVQEDSSAN